MGVGFYPYGGYPYQYPYNNWGGGWWIAIVIIIILIIIGIAIWALF